jgi:GTPase SAR1 family protein
LEEGLVCVQSDSGQGALNNKEYAIGISHVDSGVDRDSIDYALCFYSEHYDRALLHDGESARTERGGGAKYAFTVLKGCRIEVLELPDHSSQRTGTVLTEGSTFEVMTKFQGINARVDGEDQIFLQLTGLGWAYVHDPKDGTALCTVVGTSVAVYERGVKMSDLGKCHKGARMAIIVKGDTVTYQRDGEILYTSLQKPNFPLVVDSSFFSPGVRCGNVHLERRTQTLAAKALEDEHTVHDVHGEGGHAKGLLQKGGLLHSTLTRAYTTALASEGGAALNRSKLCLVGEGRVGKTCVLRSLLGRAFQHTASTVGAETGLIEAEVPKGTQGGGDGGSDGGGAGGAMQELELERFDVKDWKVVETLGIEFDSAVAQQLGHLVQQIIKFAKVRGKGLPDLSDAEIVQLQQQVEHEAGGGGGGQAAALQISLLVQRIRAGRRRRRDEEGESSSGSDSDDNASFGASEVEAVVVGAAAIDDDTDATGISLAGGGSGADDNGSADGVTPVVGEELGGDVDDQQVEEKEEEGAEDECQGDLSETGGATRDSSAVTVAGNMDGVSRFSEDMVIQLIEQQHGSNLRKIVFSTWDYGGQSIFRIVHHLFLTRFAVYLAVFNLADLAGDDATEASQEKGLGELQGWLNDLWMHAARAPVILVGTHSDVVGTDAQLEKVNSLLQDRFEGTRFWPYLEPPSRHGGRVFFPVDNTQGDSDPMMRQLRQKVEELAQAEEYIDKEVPFGWLRVLDKLQSMSQKKMPPGPKGNPQPVSVTSTGAGASAGAGGVDEQSNDGGGDQPVRRLSLSAVCTIASECGLPSSASLSLEEEVGAMLDLFHELGMLVHYNEQQLRDMVILDPQWLINLISMIIRVLDGNDDAVDGAGSSALAALHALPVDETARRARPAEWRMLVEEGLLSRPLVELLWEGLTDSVGERDILLHLLQKYDLLLIWRMAHPPKPVGRSTPSGDAAGTASTVDEGHVYMVPSMLPQRPIRRTEPAQKMPSFYLVFREDLSSATDLPSVNGSSELTFEEAAKGFLPQGLFPRLLKKAASWFQHTAFGGVGGGGRQFGGERKPVLCKQYAELSFGPVHFSLELLEAQQLVKVQLLVQNPTLVVERLEQMLAAIKEETLPNLEYMVAVHVAPDAQGLLISLDRVQSIFGAGGHELWVGKGTSQVRLERSHFGLFVPPDVEDRYDIFISYRQSSDAPFARMLFDCLAKFVYGKEGRRLKVFLDSKRLLGGRSWKQGFIDGLKRSTLLVPIVSKGALVPMSIANGFDPGNSKDWCDNVLLEWKLGLELLSMEEHPLKLVFPIMVGTEDAQSGKMGDFFQEQAQVQLTGETSLVTDVELLRVLPNANKTVGMGVAETKARLLEQLGVKAWDPASTHGNTAGDTTVFEAGVNEEWGVNIEEGCANQIYQVLVQAMREAEARKERDQALLAPAPQVQAQHMPARSSKTRQNFSASVIGTDHAGAVLIEGSLLKRSSGLVKRWQKRYFAITGNYLKYADTEDAVFTDPKAVIDLHALAMQSAEPKGVSIERGTFVRLCFVDGKGLELQAATEEAAATWHEVFEGFALGAHDGTPSDGVGAGARAHVGAGADRASTLRLQSLAHYAPRKGSLLFAERPNKQPPASQPLPASGTAAAALPTAGPATAPAVVPIHEWLSSVNVNLAKYADSFTGYGYDDTDLLKDAEEGELEEAFDELGVKAKPHRKRIMLAFQLLKLGQ